MSKKTGSRFALHSTTESVRDGRPTILACVEATFMSAALAYAVYHFRSEIPSYSLVLYVFVSGPLTLLRTRWSTNIGLELYDRVTRAVANVDKWQDSTPRTSILKEIKLFTGFLFFLICVPTLMWLIRPWSVVLAMVRGHFWHSLFAIPDNWVRTVFVLDLVYPPETVPGIEASRPSGGYRFRQHFLNAFIFAKRDYGTRGRMFRFAYTSAWLLQWVILFVPSVVLRLTIKATVPIWAPIAAIVWWRARDKRELDDKVDHIQASFSEMFIRFLAIIQFAIAFTMPVALYYFRLLGAHALPPDTQAAVPFLLSIIRWATGFDVVTRTFGAVEPWGFFAVASALITFRIFVIAKTIARRDARQRHNPPWRNTELSGLFLVRNLLSLYLIGRVLVAVLMILWPAG